MCGQRDSRVADRIGRHGRHLRGRPDRIAARDVEPNRGGGKAGDDRSAAGSLGAGAGLRLRRRPEPGDRRRCGPRAARDGGPRSGRGDHGLPGGRSPIAGRAVAGAVWPAVLVRRVAQERRSGRPGYQRHPLRELCRYGIDGRIRPGLSHRPAPGGRQTSRLDTDHLRYVSVGGTKEGLRDRPGGAGGQGGLDGGVSFTRPRRESGLDVSARKPWAQPICSASTWARKAPRRRCSTTRGGHGPWRSASLNCTSPRRAWWKKTRSVNSRRSASASVRASRTPGSTPGKSRR